MVSFRNSLVFRHTLLFAALFLIGEVMIFGFLYWATVAMYEERTNDAILIQTESLQLRFQGLSVAEMADVVHELCNDEAGEYDAFLLADNGRDYIAGNLRGWPEGLAGESLLIDVALGDGSDGHDDWSIHRLRWVTLPGGQHLIVGRNLTELARIRGLIGRAMLRVVALSLVLALLAGFTLSRYLSRRLASINTTSGNILRGELSLRIPLSGNEDELDELARNLNRMLDRIEDLIRGMREVTGNVAHDLRIPISRLRSRLEVTLMGPRDADSYREVLESTIDDADQILALFNSLLSISMAESGESSDRFERVDLAHIAHAAVEFYEPVAEEAGMEIRVHAPEAVPWFGEPHLLAQAEANLLDNAIKHASGRGPIEVRVEHSGKDPVLIVADRGPGIPTEFRAEALERFTRLEKSRTTPGSGLGLSLVRAVARLHHGTVTLKDNQPGLRVTLRFPGDSAV